MKSNSFIYIALMRYILYANGENNSLPESIPMDSVVKNIPAPITPGTGIISSNPFSSPVSNSSLSSNSYVPQNKNEPITSGYNTNSNPSQPTSVNYSSLAVNFSNIDYGNVLGSQNSSAQHQAASPNTNQALPSNPNTYVQSPSPSNPIPSTYQLSDPYNNTYGSYQKNSSSNSTLQNIPSFQSGPSNDNGIPFYGLTYTVYGAGKCLTSKEILQQVTILSKLTSKLRLYSLDCQQLELINQIIDENKLNLKLVVGLWTRNGASQLTKDLTQLIQLIKTKPTLASKLEGVLVGNEDVFNKVSTNDVIGNLNMVRQHINKEVGAKSGAIPISTAEVGSVWDPKLANASDHIYANLYSYFSPPPSGSSNLQQAAQSVITQAQAIQQKFNKPITISETGWPTGGITDQPTYAQATVSNQAEFLKAFRCLAKQNGFGYYILEPFDSKWKNGPSIENNFGFLKADGTFKDPTLKTMNSC